MFFIFCSGHRDAQYENAIKHSWVYVQINNYFKIWLAKLARAEKTRLNNRQDNNYREVNNNSIKSSADKKTLFREQLFRHGRWPWKRRRLNMTWRWR